MPECPCRGCVDRNSACHDKCEKYAEWKKQHDILMASIRNQHMYDNWYVGDVASQIRKHKRRKHRC